MVQGLHTRLRRAPLHRLPQSDDLRVVARIVEVRAFADHLPSRTRTQPTCGLGEARPMVARARSRARRMNAASSCGSDFTLEQG